MSKDVFAAGLMVALVLGVAALALVAAINAVQDDPCSEAYRECAAMTDSLGGTVDCRVEVYHCRSAGHFEFPDGTVKRFPPASADVGED
jgi:hypothetical protein